MQVYRWQHLNKGLFQEFTFDARSCAFLCSCDHDTFVVLLQDRSITFTRLAMVVYSTQNVVTFSFVLTLSLIWGREVCHKRLINETDFGYCFMNYVFCERGFVQLWWSAHTNNYEYWLDSMELVYCTVGNSTEAELNRCFECWLTKACQYEYYTSVFLVFLTCAFIFGAFRWDGNPQLFFWTKASRHKQVALWTFMEQTINACVYIWGAIKWVYLSFVHTFSSARVHVFEWLVFVFLLLTEYN